MAPGIQETGRGLADIIGGSYSPAGRLPLTWYEDERQLYSIMEYDIIYYHLTYQYCSGFILRPFGYGLSYSSFEYSELKLRIGKTAAGENDTVAVSFKLKNSGSVDAEEVPQMYVKVSGSAYRRPKKSLKSFDRLFLAAGEERTVRFDLPVKELAVWDSYSGRFRVETGRCTVSIGASSADIRLSDSFDVIGEKLLPRKISGPIYAERFDSYDNCYLHEKRDSGISAVFNSEDGGWIHFTALDFSGGVSHLSAIVQGVTGSRIEIRLDEPRGALMGTLEVPNTGEICSYELPPHSPRRLPVWAYTETTTEKIAGVHDLYLVMYRKTGVWRIDFTLV
jgi:beta-glucosidase